jgi:hypothetical protein
LRRETFVNLPAAIGVAGAVLLVAQWAGARPLWLDEEFLAVSFRDRGITDYFEPLWLGQTAPFGWLALVRLTVIAFGTGERALRLVPLLFGIATIGAAVWIGRRWMTIAGASALVLLCAFAQWLTYHVFELKPYSADAFLALVLPAIAAWAIDISRARERTTVTAETAERKPNAISADSARSAVKRWFFHWLSRPAMFWIAAAIAQWFGNGALFVTPLCALTLAAILLRREGWRSALRFSLFGVVWLATFVLNYGLVLRHAASYAFFYRFWSGAFPPEQAGPMDTLRWFITQFGGFDVKPGSARFVHTLWPAAAAGFVVAVWQVRLKPDAAHVHLNADTKYESEGRRALALLFATVPVAAVLLTALRLVPFYERLTLWMVPSLYIGVALLADVAWVSLIAGRPSGRPTPRVTAAAAALVIVGLLCGDITVRGVQEGVGRALSVADNHRLDDRAAVRWLKSEKQPGDVWITTHYGVPAIWWYAGINDERIIEVGHDPDGPECRDDGLIAALAAAPRVLVYLGFRFDDVPTGFDDLLVRRLSALGSVTAFRPFAGASDALIIDRRVTAAAPTTMSQLDPRTAADQKPLDGCFTVRVAEIPTYVR